ALPAEEDDGMLEPDPADLGDDRVRQRGRQLDPVDFRPQCPGERPDGDRIEDASHGFSFPVAWSGAARQSARMFAARTTSAHRATSSRMKDDASSGRLAMMRVP